MSTKVLFKTMFPIIVLAVIILAAQVGNSQSALDPAPEVPMEDRSIAGPDYYERRKAELAANYFAGSDYIERNPSNYYTGSDYFERNELTFSAVAAPDLAGSDWIERHPTVVISADYYAGSDFIERRPSNYYTGSDYFERNELVFSAVAAPDLAGSDWIERHPALAKVDDYFDGSDFIERHPSNFEADLDRSERHPWCVC